MLDLKYPMNLGGETNETINKSNYNTSYFRSSGFAAPSKPYPAYRILETKPRSED